MELREFVTDVLREDVGPGDYTTLATVPPDVKGRSALLVKEDGILAGMRVAKAIIETYDPTMVFDAHFEDGQFVQPGQKAFYLEGSAANMLTLERTVLNVMQRMSGIATQTRRLVKIIEHHFCKVWSNLVQTLISLWCIREYFCLGCIGLRLSNNFVIYHATEHCCLTFFSIFWVSGNWRIGRWCRQNSD